ncbi:MAG: hypothetical protein ACREIA_05220 [Opitutaceae bacterium]
MTQTPSAPARKIRKSEFAGKGALVQLFGLAGGAAGLYYAPSTGVGVVSIVAGLVLLIIGGRMACRHICGSCGNRVDKISRVCPHCQARFE